MGRSYDATGEIHTIGETTSYGNNGFEKREFVIKVTGVDENPTYPQYLGLELVKEKCTLISNYSIGQEIKVYFNLGGRLWAGNGKPEKCFNSLVVWKIEAVGGEQPRQPQQQEQASPSYEEGQYVADQDNGDIPF